MSSSPVGPTGGAALRPSAQPSSLTVGAGAARYAIPQRTLPHALTNLHSPAWLYSFIAAEIALQLLIITPWGEKARVLVRSGGFVASFSLLFVLRRSRVAHPAWKMALAAMAILTASMFHPDTNGAWAGCATAFLNLAVVAPIFWVPRVRADLATVRRVFFMLWAFNTASAVFGALQVYFPGQFQPTLSSAMSDDYVRALSFELADGTRVLRPMGLTNGPGGAAIGAMYSLVLGVALLLDRPRAWVRAVVVAGMGFAIFTLFLSQIRAFVVMSGVSLVAMSVPLVVQRRFRRFGAFAILTSALVVVGLVVAMSTGGDAVTTRLSTLIAGDPATVYNDSRGAFLRYTFTTMLTQYPVGAGLGRWGVISNYFGDNLNASYLWAEIQWTGWLYDGGIPLMVVYTVAMMIALRVSLRIATTGANAAERDLQKWATAVFGYSVGTLALTFSAVPFQSTMGIDFWLLNATVFAASHTAMRSASSR
jgi:hypothetical protein